MKEKLFRIQRQWDRPQISITIVDDQKPSEQIVRVGYDKQKIYIDTPVADFKARLAEVATNIIVKKHADRIRALRYTFRQATMEDLVKRIVDDVLKESFEILATEMKEFTKVVV